MPPEFSTIIAKEQEKLENQEKTVEELLLTSYEKLNFDKYKKYIAVMLKKISEDYYNYQKSYMYAQEQILNEQNSEAVQRYDKLKKQKTDLEKENSEFQVKSKLKSCTKIVKKAIKKEIFRNTEKLKNINIEIENFEVITENNNSLLNTSVILELSNNKFSKLIEEEQNKLKQQAIAMAKIPLSIEVRNGFKTYKLNMEKLLENLIKCYNEYKVSFKSAKKHIGILTNSDLNMKYSALKEEKQTLENENRELKTGEICDGNLKKVLQNLFDDNLEKIQKINAEINRIVNELLDNDL